MPDGIALLVGNDLCCDETITGVNVVTRSMTAAQAAQNDQLISQKSANDQLELSNDTCRIPPNISGTGKATNIKFGMHIHSDRVNKSP